jgi:hypothetical protein
MIAAATAEQGDCQCKRESDDRVVSGGCEVGDLHMGKFSLI